MANSYTLHGLDELIDEIEQWPDLALEAANPAMYQALLYLHAQLPQYPPPPGPSSPSPLRTDRQRRWFFAALREGRIRVPYQRTGTLGRSFTEEVDVSTDGVTGSLGTNRPYAPWVVGPTFPGEQINGQTMYQALIHQGRWWQLGAVLDENISQVELEFEQAFWVEWERLVENAGQGTT